MTKRAQGRLNSSSSSTGPAHLDEVADFLDDEEGPADDDDEGDHAPAERVDEHQRQRQAPHAAHTCLSPS